MGNIKIRIPELQRMALRYPAFAESCEIEIIFLIERELGIVLRLAGGF